MPYIKKEDRQPFECIINMIVNELTHYDENTPPVVGEVNYVISRVIWDLYRKHPSYTTGNNLMGALECVKQEFYRRQLAIYEDEKIKSNGDI